MNNDIIEWDNRYTVGIEQIDDQHRELLKMTNNLCLGCRKEDGPTKIFFQLTIHEVVNFLKYHFFTEEQILEDIRYPDITTHKQQHNDFVKSIFDEADKVEKYQQSGIQNFTYHLRSVIIAHITLIDKKYATYIHILNRNRENRSGEYSLPTELFLG